MVCADTYSESDNALLRYGHLKFSNIAAGRHLEFDPTGNGVVSKMTSHCTGSVQMREESESRIRK